MLRLGLGARCATVACVLALVALLYAAPTLMEFRLLRTAGPFLALVVLGDIVGCAVIAVWNWHVAAAIYLLLALLKLCALEFRLIDVSILVWMTDLAPTILISALALLRLRFNHRAVSAVRRPE